jgi:Arc/MetJ-type ribon-helix-helix transcriptional regulator
MTTLSFRVTSEYADDVQRWVERLGVDRSELLREALRRYLVRLQGEAGAGDWEVPPTESERSLAEIADWGPPEDWSDWADATG